MSKAGRSPAGKEIKEMSSYIHAPMVASATSGIQEVVEDSNRKVCARRVTRAEVTLSLVTGEELPCFLISIFESGGGEQRWITDPPTESGFVLGASAPRRVGELLNLPTLHHEPLGYGSFERWGRRCAVEAQVMTSLILAKR